MGDMKKDKEVEAYVALVGNHIVGIAYILD